ncbi:MAG: guanylate kinase [Proteobacteria bacterium]|jgi:guanylate kinase|nr:guanylate kinase [Pseudomonadota bacterium]
MDARDPALLIVSSPSGAGKTTLCHRLLAEFSDTRFSVSHTTRRPRPNEVDGRDYHFVEAPVFEAMIRSDAFIEWAHVHGNRYGTAHAEIRAAAADRCDVVFDVDYQGAAQIKTKYPEAIGVFVLPPSLAELRRRLESRGTETKESLDRRFEAAIGEISHHAEFDYLLVNDDVDGAYDRLRAILLSQRIRHGRVRATAERLMSRAP